MNKKCHKLTALLLAAAFVLSFLPSCFAAEAEKATQTGKMIAEWNFDAGIDGWYYGGSGWEYDYHGTNGEITSENGTLKLNVDYSQDGGSSWSQVAVCYWSDEGMILAGVQKMTLDVIYDPAKLDGGFTVKAYSNSGTAVAADTTETVITPCRSDTEKGM